MIFSFIPGKNPGFVEVDVLFFLSNIHHLGNPSRKKMDIPLMFSFVPMDITSGMADLPISSTGWLPSGKQPRNYGKIHHV